MVGVGVEIVEWLVFVEVAVRDEVVHVGVGQRRPGLQVGLVGLLLHLSAVYMLHRCLVLRNEGGAFLRRDHALVLPRACILLARHGLRGLPLVRHPHLGTGLPLLRVDGGLLVGGTGGNTELRQSCFILHVVIDRLFRSCSIGLILVGVLLTIVP